jgi:hypothetical protein
MLKNAKRNVLDFRNWDGIGTNFRTQWGLFQQKQVEPQPQFRQKHIHI